jgi:hypothetical protein
LRCASRIRRRCCCNTRTLLLPRREQFFEAARITAQKDFQKNPKDAQVGATHGSASAGRVAAPPPWHCQSCGGHAQSCSVTAACVLQALVRWGGALLELAHFKQGSEADQYIQDVSERGAIDCVQHCSCLTGAEAAAGGSARSWPSYAPRAADTQQQQQLCPPPSLLGGSCWLLLPNVPTPPTHHQQAIDKLQEALDLDAERTDAMWCLGNAYTSMVRL